MVHLLGLTVGTLFGPLEGSFFGLVVGKLSGAQDGSFVEVDSRHLVWAIGGIVLWTGHGQAEFCPLESDDKAIGHFHYFIS